MCEALDSTVAIYELVFTWTIKIVISVGSLSFSVAANGLMWTVSGTDMNSGIYWIICSMDSGSCWTFTPSTCWWLCIMRCMCVCGSDNLSCKEHSYWPHCTQQLVWCNLMHKHPSMIIDYPVRSSLPSLYCSWLLCRTCIHLLQDAVSRGILSRRGKLSERKRCKDDKREWYMWVTMYVDFIIHMEIY